MLIALDLDGVLADVTPIINEWHNETYGTNFTTEQLFSKDYRDIWQVSREEEITRGRKFFESPYFWKIQPVAGAQRGITKLAKGNKLVVVTARYLGMRTKSLIWIARNFDDLIDEIYFTGEWFETRTEKTKEKLCRELGVDLIIEDNLTYARQCAVNGTKALLLDYPNNKSVELEGIRRVKSWEEIPGVVYEMQ